MEMVFIFLMSIVNLAVAVVNLTVATKNRQEKDLRCASESPNTATG